MQDLLKHDKKFRYQMLGRLREDCDYYLGNGNQNPENLWAGDEKKQIKAMKDFWNSFAEKDKPEWLSLEQIEKYEKEMLEDKNGTDSKNI